MAKHEEVIQKQLNSSKSSNLPETARYEFFPEIPHFSQIWL